MMYCIVTIGTNFHIMTILMTHTKVGPWGPKFRISSPTHGGKVLTFEPQEAVKAWFTSVKVISLLFYAKTQDLLLRVGSSFLALPVSQHYKS